MKIKKIFIIIFLLILFIINTTNCYAFSNDIDYNYICDTKYYSNYIDALSNNKYYKDNDYCYFMYYNYGQRVNFVVFIKKSDINIQPYLSYLRTADSKNECFNLYFSSKNKSDVTIYPYSLNLSNNTLSSYYPSWLLSSDSKGLYLDSLTGWITNNDLKIYLTSNCSTDIYTDSKCKSVFFQPTPLVGVHLVEITQVTEIPQTIITMIRKIIPIGLVVFSILLVIYLIRLVILRRV